jgi:hypothetical protein
VTTAGSLISLPEASFKFHPKRTTLPFTVFVTPFVTMGGRNPIKVYFATVGVVPPEGVTVPPDPPEPPEPLLPEGMVGKTVGTVGFVVGMVGSVVGTVGKSVGMVGNVVGTAGKSAKTELLKAKARRNGMYFIFTQSIFAEEAKNNIGYPTA